MSKACIHVRIFVKLLCISTSVFRSSVLGVFKHMRQYNNGKWRCLYASFTIGCPLGLSDCMLKDNTIMANGGVFMPVSQLAAHWVYPTVC